MSGNNIKKKLTPKKNWGFIIKFRLFVSEKKNLVD